VRVRGDVPIASFGSVPNHLPTVAALQAATIHFNPWTADHADFADGLIRAIRMIRGQKL
jgi:hypothetical protein